jgi:hypothetical protein
LEQAWRKSYHAADFAVLSPAELAGENPDKLCFSTHPSFALISSRYAVHSIYCAAKGQGEMGAFDPAQSEKVLVTRPNYDVLTRVLNVGESAFISGFHARPCC